MTISKDTGRQYVLSTDYLTVDITSLDVSAQAEEAFELPPNAVVVGGEIIVDTVWNSGTSDVLDLGDEVDVNRYLAAVDLTALARTEFVDANLGFLSVEADTIDAIWTGVGAAPTTGSARIRVFYVVQGRTNENEGTGDEFQGSGN